MSIHNIPIITEAIMKETLWVVRVRLFACETDLMVNSGNAKIINQNDCDIVITDIYPPRDVPIEGSEKWADDLVSKLSNRGIGPKKVATYQTR